MGESDWDDTSKTELYSEIRWLEPVDAPSDLPTEGVKPGTLCFVDSDQSVYGFVDGTWIIRETLSDT